MPLLLCKVSTVQQGQRIRRRYPAALRRSSNAVARVRTASDLPFGMLGLYLMPFRNVAGADPLSRKWITKAKSRKF
jgi:hypothetical protein